MSKPEMPPLDGGQVWVDDERVFLVGPLDYQGFRVFTICRSLRMFHPEACPDDVLRNEYLSFYKCRLIHGPGAPWSPEETSHA